MKRIVELKIKGSWDETITVRAVINGVNFTTDMTRVQDELTSRLMVALTNLPVVNVPLGRVRVS